MKGECKRKPSAVVFKVYNAADLHFRHAALIEMFLLFGCFQHIVFFTRGQLQIYSIKSCCRNHWIFLNHRIFVKLCEARASCTFHPVHNLFYFIWIKCETCTSQRAVSHKVFRCTKSKRKRKKEKKNMPKDKRQTGPRVQRINFLHLIKATISKANDAT